MSLIALFVFCTTTPVKKMPLAKSAKTSNAIAKPIVKINCLIIMPAYLAVEKEFYFFKEGN